MSLWKPILGPGIDLQAVLETNAEPQPSNQVCLTACDLQPRLPMAAHAFGPGGFSAMVVGPVSDREHEDALEQAIRLLAPSCIRCGARVSGGSFEIRGLAFCSACHAETESVRANSIGRDFPQK